MALNSQLRSPGLLNYVRSLSEDEHPALSGLRAATLNHEFHHMQSAPEQMALIAILLKLMGASHVLEVGCFTGYGTLAMALALPPDGDVTTLDINDHWVATGRPFWRDAGVEQRITYMSGLAADSLEQLCDEGRKFDFVYIDADKKSYPSYLDAALKLTRIGSLIALDNVLWNGSVANLDDSSKQAVSLRSVAARIRDDCQLASCLIPIGDGLMIARREA